MLLPENRYVGIGAACMSGKLLVVEDFAMPSWMTLHAHATPPLDPFVANDPGGATC